jgi:mono/diheme cytochrome c family protein
VLGEMKQNVKNGISLVIIMTSAVIIFQNCGRIGFQAQKGGAFGSVGIASEACEGMLKQTYSQTYFPILSVNCNACHSGGHGSTNLDISFQGFQSKGMTMINYKATNPHGDNGLNLSSELATIKEDWDVGQAQYMECLSSADSGGTSGGKLKVNGKPVPDIATTGVPAQQNAWKTVEWDLETEVPPARQGQFRAMLKIEARLALNGMEIVGMDFRNPMMKLKSAGNGQYMKVNGLNIYIDKLMMSNVTMYTGVSATVIDTNYLALAPGSGVALAYMPDINVSMPVAIELTDVQFTGNDGTTTTTMPGGGAGEKISWTQLTSNDATVNVFRRRCYTCHQGGNSQKGLDLSNYANSAGKATEILGRVNNAGSPMPPSGLLSNTERDLIGRWVNNGAPQN